MPSTPSQTSPSTQIPEIMGTTHLNHTHTNFLIQQGISLTLAFCGQEHGVSSAPAPKWSVPFLGTARSQHFSSGLQLCVDGAKLQMHTAKRRALPSTLSQLRVPREYCTAENTGSSVTRSWACKAVVSCGERWPPGTQH